MWIKTHRYLVRIKEPYLINASSPRTYKSRYNKELKQRKGLTVNKTEYQSKRNPTGKPLWARQTAKASGHTISSIDKSLSRNRHRVWSPTHQRSIKEESKVANHDWVDHQAWSLLQNINFIANLFIMGNYFNELRQKLLEPTIFFNLYTNSP